MSGWTLHGEIDAMLGAGLPPWQALSAATCTPGEFIAKTVPGRSEIRHDRAGYRADPLPVAENPLEKPARLRLPAGVMAGGRWYNRAMLADVAERRAVH